MYVDYQIQVQFIALMILFFIDKWWFVVYHNSLKSDWSCVNIQNILHDLREAMPRLQKYIVAETFIYHNDSNMPDELYHFCSNSHSKSHQNTEAKMSFWGIFVNGCTGRYQMTTSGATSDISVSMNAATNHGSFPHRLSIHEYLKIIIFTLQRIMYCRTGDKPLPEQAIIIILSYSGNGLSPVQHQANTHKQMLYWPVEINVEYILNESTNTSVSFVISCHDYF